MSQRGRLMLTLAAAMLPLVLLALGLLWRDAQAVENRIARDRVALAQAGALTVTAYLEGNLRTLQVVAAELAGVSPQEARTLQPWLSLKQQSNPWSGLGIHDSEGTRLVGTLQQSPEAPPVSISDRGYFQRVQETGEPTVSNAVIGRGTGRPTVVLAVPLPMADGERGVLVAPIHLESLSTGMLSALGADGVRVMLVDGAGQIVVHPDPEQVANLTSMADREEVLASQRGEMGSLIGDRGGVQRLVAYAPVPSVGWTVVISEPSSIAFAPARELLLQGAGLLGVTLVAVLAIGWVLGGLVSRSYASEQRARQDAELQRRSAQDSQQRYADLVDGLDGVVWEARADDLTFTYVSPASESVLGHPADYWLAGPSRWGDQMHPDDAAFTLEHCVAELREGHDHSCEYRAIHADGRVIWVADMIRATLSDDGSAQLLRGIMIDVTARHQVEEERTRLLSAEQRARAEAEDAVRSRDEFLSIASHELRNPVAAIKGTGQLIRRLADRGSLSERAEREYLDTIVRTSDRLARLVEDLLDVSRLRGDQFQLRMESIDVATLVREATSTEALAGREVRVDGLEHALELLADPDRVQQILQNLLENAAKYSPSSTPIDLVVRVEGGRLEVAVTDYGIGLPPGSERTLFTPFGRAPNAVSANIPGMGLGLYISRRLAEAHGGTLVVQSAGEGHGSTFRLLLPLAPVGDPNRAVGVMGGVTT